jgi:hypothetical protein
MRWICNALGIPETHLVEMFSLRKMLGSLVVGTLALSVAAGTAGAAADNEVALAVAQRGFEAGVEAAVAQIDACVEECSNPQLLKALTTVTALVEAKAEQLAVEGWEEEGLPQGPDQAARVLEQLLYGDSPSELAPGKEQSVLAKMYKELKAQQVKIKAEKDKDKGKPDDGGKPDDPGNRNG